MLAPSAVRALWLFAALLLGNGVEYGAGDVAVTFGTPSNSTASDLEWANDVDDLLDRFDVDNNSTCLSHGVSRRSCVIRS
jgi:ethanolamine ammonia-lyase large subunit